MRSSSKKRWVRQERGAAAADASGACFLLLLPDLPICRPIHAISACRVVLRRLTRRTRPLWKMTTRTQPRLCRRGPSPGSTPPTLFTPGL